jgi:two-component system, chemotaxis family, response regulator Rcp1
MKPAQIVLIEDNPGDVLLVEMALEENGILCQVTQFDNGAEALRVLCETPSENDFLPDAILLDLNTPRSDGFEVLIRLKQFPRLSHVPIAILTSSPASIDRHRAALQSVLFIQKPSRLPDFLAAVGQAVKAMLRACD